MRPQPQRLSTPSDADHADLYRLLVESIRDYAIFMVDPAGRVMSWNPGVERIKGYRANEIIGRHFELFYTPEERAAGRPGRALATALREGRYEEEGVRIRKDGTRFWASVVIAPLVADDGTLRGFAKVTRDVTERKHHEAAIERLAHELEERVQQRTRELAEVNEELEAFCYSVSHDLRAPLRGMQGFAQALEEDYADKLDEEARDYIARITRGARRMEHLIEDLLEYSRLSREQIQLSPVALDAVVDDALARMSAEAQAHRAAIRVERPLPQAIGHHGTLVRVVSNLLANAIKFVPAGRLPAVRLHAEDAAECVRLCVEDNGIGIEPAHVERIFRVFERLHSGESYPGTGIGLALVRKGVERMHGSAGVDSAPGEGSRFWIRLPSRPPA